MLQRGIRLWLIGAAVWATVMIGQEAPKKLTRSEATSAIVSRTQPDYPPVARQLKLEGTVELEVVISEQGTVDDVRIVSGNPVLTKAAAQAVKKWKFTPVTDGGKPVKAVAPLSLTFKL
jgi:protein TonB